MVPVVGLFLLLGLLAWVAAIAAFVLLEKVVPHDRDVAGSLGPRPARRAARTRPWSARGVRWPMPWELHRKRSSSQAVALKVTTPP